MHVDSFFVKSDRQFGFKQKQWFLLLCLFSMYVPFHIVQVVFTGIIPKFTCMVGNETLEVCPTDSKCDNFSFSQEGPDSFLKQWSTNVCEDSWVATLIQSSFMVGILLGATLLGRAADEYGRKQTLLYCLVALILLTATGSFVPWVWLYAVFRFFQGFFSAGNLDAVFVLISELVGPSVRGLCGNVFQFFFGLGIISLAALSYAIQFDWRVLSLTCGLLGLVLLPLAIAAPESPRWLFTQGRDAEAMKILSTLTGIHVNDIPTYAVHSTQKASDVHILHFIRLRFCVFVTLLLSWFTNAMVYYALTLSNIGNFSTYAGTAISGAVELPAYLISAFLIEWAGRKYPLVIYMIIGGLSCLISVILQCAYVALVGKLCIAASFSIIYIHSNEIFPTVVRNSGVGICSSFARFGAIAASAFLHKDPSSYTVIILGGMCIISGLMNLVLPETLNCEMPETLEELDVNGEYREHYAPLLPTDNGSTWEGEEEVIFSRREDEP